MRKSIITILLIILVVPNVFARKIKSKAGKVDNLIYTDKTYNFQVNFLESWKYSIKKDKSNFRFILIKKNYEIPPDYLDAPDYTMIPRLTLWVGETVMSPFEFIDSVLSPTYKSKQKKEILKEFDILNDNITDAGDVREKLVTRQKKALKVDGNKTLRWIGKMEYRKDVATSASSAGGKRVRGSYGGSIIAIKKDSNIYLYHFICEWNYFDGNLEEVMGIINSMKF